MLSKVGDPTTFALDEGAPDLNKVHGLFLVLPLGEFVAKLTPSRSQRTKLIESPTKSVKSRNNPRNPIAGPQSQAYGYARQNSFAIKGPVQ